MPMTDRHQHQSDPPAGFARREILAHDQRVTRHDAALRQAEQRGDDVERGQAVERQIQHQRQALQGRAEDQRADAADPVGDEAGREPADDAEAEHQGQHLRAARRAVAEVAAIGDHMHLRHRHRDAARDRGEHQHALQDRGRRRHAGDRGMRTVGRRCAMIDRRLAPHQQRDRHHRHDAEHADAHEGIAPADGLDGGLQDQRPDRAGEVVAAGDDRHGDATPLHEPVRDVGHQRSEGAGCAEPADQHRMDNHEAPVGVHVGRDDITDAQHHRPEDQRQHDAEAVDQPAHHRAPDGECHHGRSVGDGGAAAVDAELRLDGRQHHDAGPQPDATDCRKRNGRRQPPPRGGAIQFRDGCGSVHVGCAIG